MTQYLPTPAAILIGHLGLTPRTPAEIQDLYSRPLSVAQSAASKQRGTA
jgi:hypothetical protein